MVSSNTWKLKALIKKNLLILKRNIISTAMEILFPIALMLIIFGIRSAFDIEIKKFEKEEIDISHYLGNKSVAYPEFSKKTTGGSDFTGVFMANEYFTSTYERWVGMPIFPPLKICSGLNKKTEPRNIIGLVGLAYDDFIIDKIKDDNKNYKYTSIKERAIKNMTDNIEFKKFTTVDEIEDYVRSPEYSREKPQLCFGLGLFKEGNKYTYTLHYFSSNIQDVPSSKKGMWDSFQTGPDMDSLKLYQQNGYIYIMKLINEFIIDKESGKTKTSEIDLLVSPMKYIDYREDPFASFTGYMIPFFIVIAYMCPLCLYVMRMVGEKENRSKEGMKIMGLSEGIYFLSYFIQYFIINIFISLINALIVMQIFSKIPFFVMFLTFFLWSMDIFALIFFFQSFIDKTRIALILSLLVYFVMYFLSMACMQETSSKTLKIIMSFLPPVCIELGVVLMGKFDGHFKRFHTKDYFETYTNYSVSIMNLIQLIDFFLYLFLGYYLTNVLSHDYGIAKPWYFLFTSEYWCGKKSTKEKKKKNEEINQIVINDKLQENQNIQNINNHSEPTVLDKGPDFESEELYNDRNGPSDVLKIEEIVKVFEGTEKPAVNHVNLNFYKDEIFALLGHNGAGKTTLISMLTGLYEATEGSAYFDGMDILIGNNMDKFRSILGICPQHDVLFDDLTIKEHLEMFCIFKGYNSDLIEENVQKTINDFELESIQNIIAKNLSAGQRRKLSIAISLVGGSKVIFLDEPSSGMDITSRRNLWDILKRQTEGKIIILTTHYMEEASVLGGRIGIINAGKMKCIGTPLFLIERFGKKISLNITKEEGANNEEIKEFIFKKLPDSECEVLSEEIMFRIHKNNFNHKQEETDKLSLSSNKSQKAGTSNITIKSFFDDLDKNVEKLKIKSYSASMPTLEDVFLNVAQEEVEGSKNEEEKMGKLHRKFSQVNNENDTILFKSDYKEDFSRKSKFANDFKACFKRRGLLTINDKKGVIMEILCPILLVLAGLGVSKVDVFRKIKPDFYDITSIGDQKLMYGRSSSVSSSDMQSFYLKNYVNVTSEELSFTQSNPLDRKKDIENFLSSLYEVSKNTEDSSEKEVDMTADGYIGYYGAYLILKKDTSSSNCKYEIFEAVNARIAHGIPIYSFYILREAVKNCLGSSYNIEIEGKHSPMPYTLEEENAKDSLGNSLIVFFVSIAFALIPANFITIIVKEKFNNSKHLMRISGINPFAYWIVNFIFELIKYYFTCGICLLLLLAFSFYKKWLALLYALYGPPMILLTYVFSFIFVDETTAQNGTILINFLIGALGSSVILVFRMIEKYNKMAKILGTFLNLLPSYCFDFGYSILLNKDNLFYLENSDDILKWYKLRTDEKAVLKEFYYCLGLILFLVAEIVVYGILLGILEFTSYKHFSASQEKISSSVKDKNVQNEIARANKIDINDSENAVVVRNLKKIYKAGGCCNSEIIEGISNLNFCVGKGECFGLLGLNGAGKTSTFKCITQEEGLSNGQIYINGKEVTKEFEEVSKLFGYCPQFDAIFEYMTVYENLEFYGRIKGIRKDCLENVVNALIEEMSLTEYRHNKKAGQLSGGNKRKLSVAISFLCNPPILLLDEPSTGMDPEARRFMWSVIHKISSQNSSVIMTTHSMDEAETLCKRMGIMVNGEFVCLGKANEIKENYGYGYEIDVRIKPLSEKKLEELYKTYRFQDKKLKVTKENIGGLLIAMDKKNFSSELHIFGLGSKLIRDIELNGSIPLSQLINWTFFVENALKFIHKAKDYFNEIILSEHIENNFLFKLKKKEKKEDNKTIGFLFGLFETAKEECNVTEYSIQQTSLEQIFNKFAEKQVKSRLEKQQENEKNLAQEGEVKNIIIVNNTLFNNFLK